MEKRIIFCTNDPGKMRHTYAKKKVNLDLCLISYIKNEFKMDSRPGIRYTTLKRKYQRKSS